MTAHALTAVRQCVAAGVDGIEHCSCFCERGVLAQIGQFHRAGMRLISGVDSGINPVKPHGLLPQAIIELVAAGVPPTTALASATGLAAQACGLANLTGRLKAGLNADLLLVDGDPTTDINAISKIRAVISRGRPHRRENGN